MKCSAITCRNNESCLLFSSRTVAFRRSLRSVLWRGNCTSPSAVTAHRYQKKPRWGLKTVCAAKKKKQQFGRSANAATPGSLDEELEAAYRQFGRALGETPRETSKVVRDNLNISAASPKPALRRAGSPAGSNERRMSEESYAQFEAMLDRAMKGSGDSQPKSLLKGKNTVALRAGERERREVMMELMESTLYPQTESFSIDLGLDLIQPAAKKPQEQVPELILPRGKVAAPVKPPAAAGKPQGTPAHAQPLPVPALQMPKGKLPKMQRSATAAAAAPAAPPPPLPVPAVAAKPSLAPPKVDWKVTEIDEDYLSSRQETTPLSQKASQLTAAALDPSPPAWIQEPLPAITRPAKPSRTQPEHAPQPAAASQAASLEPPAPVRDAASKPAPKAQPRRSVSPPPKLAAPPVQQRSNPKAASEDLPDSVPSAGEVAAPSAAPSVAGPRRSTAEGTAEVRLAQPPRPVAPPVPVLQRPTAAPQEADRPGPTAQSLEPAEASADAAPADAAAAVSARNALEQPVFPETAEAASVAPAVSEAATAAPAGGTSSYSAAAGASEDLQVATATAREESDAEKLVKPALSPPLQRAAAPDAKPAALQAPARRGADGTAAWQRGYDLATAALATERPLAGVVVSGSSGGVLVRVRAGFQGFLPFSKMLLQRQIALRERERAAQATADPPQGLPVQREADAQLQEARLQLRRDVMAGLQGQRVMVYVHDVKRAEGEMFYKVFLSEKGPKSEPNPDVPPYLAEALERKVGERVSATVGKLVDYGALLRFEVEVDADYMCEVWGLLHHSKMGRLVLESLQEGEHLDAYVLSAMNGRAELSVEPSQRMNVNQTLEDLLMGDPTAEEGQEGSDEAIESMPEALEVCRELMLSGAISEATPGRRLQGRAFSPEIQVFMARDEGEVAGNGAGTEGGPKRYTLLARARNEVQEIEVESDLEREEMKRALGLALSVVLGVM